MSVEGCKMLPMLGCYVLRTESDAHNMTRNPGLRGLLQRTTLSSRLLQQASRIEDVHVFLSGFLRATKQDSPSNKTAKPVLCVTEGVAGSKYTSYILILKYDNAPHRVKCYEQY